MAEISEMERKMKKAMKKAEEPKFIMRVDDVQKARLVTLAKAHHLDMTAYIQKLLKKAWDEYLIVNKENNQ
jgi:predicted HicB family RNase H-like nuclease|tara:strand:+ start:1901 stop:2113 length:213 start_codon:yes stop_codon:yes gene_type:complete